MAELPRPLPPPTWRDRALFAVDRVRAVPRRVVVAVAVPTAIVATLGGAAALGGAIRLPAGSSGPPPELSLPRADQSAAGDGAAGDGAAERVTSSTAATVLRVHAAGAVVAPGVVQVPAGSRVADVVAAAGGPNAEADLDQVNLAAPVSDGERVYVPRRGETVPVVAPSGAVSAAAQRVVNLNSAGLSELETLPGVGPATAQAIVDYRAQRGRFRAVDDLLNVRGIGPSKLAQIRPHARV